MQGRLSPRPEHRLQAFPHQHWPEEFAQAKRLGFSYLEWIYEAERARENPIASAAGRAAIRSCATDSGLPGSSKLLSWVPGRGLDHHRADIGTRLPAGKYINWQLH